MIIRGYFAAPVRGVDGDNVDKETKEYNVQLGIEIGQAIARAFPCLDLVIPHEHELIIDRLWRNGVSSETIVQSWCEIVEGCQILIVFTGNGVGGGIQREMETARQAGKIVFEFERWDEYAKERLARVLNEIMIKYEMQGE